MHTLYTRTLRVYMCTCKYIHMYKYIDTIYIYMYIYARMRAYIYARMRAFTFMHTYIYVCKDTHRRNMIDDWFLFNQSKAASEH